MMAGSVDEIGGETQLCSHQDCGGTGTKFDCNGNGNVCRDLDVSYVFVSGVGGGDRNGCGLSGEENCDREFAVGTGKEVDLHCEFTSEDRVEGETGEDLESRSGSSLELEVREGTVIVSEDKSELSDKSGEDVEENFVVMKLEVGESEQSGTIGLGDAECELGKVEAEVGEEEAQERIELKLVEGDSEMKEMSSDAQVGERQEGAITLAGTGESDKSVKAVEQDLVVPSGDFKEGNQSNTVALGDDICELAEIRAGIEVDVGEGKLKDQTELNSVEETLESDVRKTQSVDCVSHDLEENQYKVEDMTALDSELDGGIQMGYESSAVADKEIICTAAANDFKDLDKCMDGSQRVDKLDLTPSDAATPYSMDNVPIECGENITAGTDDCAAVEHEASKSVVQGISAANSTELDSNINQTYAELIEHFSAKISGSVLASIDNGTVSDKGPGDADCGVGQGQGNDAERVVLDTNGTVTTETATRSVMDQSEISQINLGEQSRACTKSPELNGNPDNEAIECGENVTAGTDVCAAVEHEASKSLLVQGISAANSTELDSNINQPCGELIEHVPAKTFESVLVSIDNGTVSDQGPGDADCGVGQVQGNDAERMALDTNGTLTTETATRSITNHSKISQINLGEQRSGCTKSPELNGNPDNVAIECGENITAGTDDCAALEHEASKSVLVQGISAENSTELDSIINQPYAELIEHVPAKIFGSVLASIDNGTVSDQGPGDADCGVGQVQGNDAERVALDTNGTLTTETATTCVMDQSEISQINLGERRSVSTKSPELNRDPNNAHSDCMVPQVQRDVISRSDCNGATILEPEGNLVCPVTDNKSELETKHFYTEDVKSGIFSETDGTESEIGVANGLSSYAPNDVRSETKIEFGTIDSAEIKSWGRNSLSKSQVLNGDIDCNHKQAIFPTNLVESEGCAGMSLKSDVQNHSALNRSDMHAKDATVAFIGDSVDGQSLGNVPKAKPFQFLAKFPRIDDDKLREQIRNAQLLVEEKTVLRNNIRCEIDIKRSNLQSLGDEFEAMKSDERAARRLVKLKRQEIDSVQEKINRVKNSVSVMEITNRIAHMEHMIEHETHPLKEEKQLLREINVLKKLRGQISENVCSAEEVCQALSHLEPTEMQLKTLKKELGDLKDKVSKAEAAVILLGKQYNDESKKLRELQARFRAANDIRQDAYKNLLGLKRQLHEKGKHFWIYKDDAKAAGGYALSGDKEALYHLCAKQVDTFMDLWNKNDEFREDYVRCNMKSTLRRLKTLDGRSLGPDEEVHVFPVYVGERESRKLNNPSRKTNPSSPTILKQENTAQSVEREPIDDKSLVMAEPKSKMLKSKTSVNHVPESGLRIGFTQLEVEETKEEEKQKTKEELELARKDEMLRKKEIDAKLKEQLRQEEKVKAQEALERKKRNADKAQMRAVLRAQKEAEQKEKEREKRMRKKEKKEKKTTDDGNVPELQTNHIKDESKDSPPTKPCKTSHFSRYNKTKATIPPALRNRGKRRLKQLAWWIFGGLMIVLLIFLVVNGGASKNLRSRKDDSYLGNHQSTQPIWQS